MIRRDIVIVGAGIVGLTLANCLRDSGLSVTVLERRAPASFGETIENRVSAINKAAADMLRATGAWQFVPVDRICAYHRMQVWDSTGVGEISFDSAELGLDDLGHIIENSVLQVALQSNLAQHESVDFRTGCEIDRIEMVEGGCLIHPADGETIECQLLVGADGVNSMVRAVAGIEYPRQSYAQRAIVTTVSTEQPHDATAWQCFLSSGPLAFLPLANGQSSIVWSLDEELVDERMSMSDADFTAALAEAFEYRLGAVVAVGERQAFPLSHGHASHYVQSNLALIGDAAHTIHPLAGQGANLGIMDAVCLAGVITEARRKDRRWAAYHTLRAYERQRKLENLGMEHAMTAFQRLFGNDDPMLSMVRNAGLNLTDSMTSVKNGFMRRALGL